MPTSSFGAFKAVAKPILLAADSLTGLSGALVSDVVPIILIGLTITIIWYGFEILRGGGGPNPFLDIFAKSLRAFLVFQICLAGAMYTTNVVDFVSGFRGDMTNKVAVATGGAAVDMGALGSYQNIDSTMEKAAQGTNKIFEWGYENISFNPLKANMTGFVAIAAGALMMGCMVVYGFVATANLLLIDFALKIIFGLGPLFIACFAFQSTARFFDAWLGAVLKYTFTAIVIACVVGLGNGIIDGFAAKLSADPGTMDFLGAAVGALGACAVLIGIAIRAPSIAADMVGGIGIAALGPGAIARPLAAMAAGAAKGGASAAGKAVAAASPAARAAAGAAGAAAGAAGNAMSYGAGAARSAMGQTSLGKKAISAAKGMGAALSARTANMRQGVDNFGSAVGGSGQSGARAQMSSAYQTGKKAANPRPIPTPLPKLNLNI